MGSNALIDQSVNVNSGILRICRRCASGLTAHVKEMLAIAVL
jgi:hypothetical protein